MEYLAEKGLMARATASARKAAVSKVLGILDESESQDVTAIDLDSVMSRFGHLQGKGYTPQSLVTYRSRVKAALDDFSSYVQNPLAFKPSLQPRERKPSSDKIPLNSERGASGGGVPEGGRQTSPPIAGPMASSILPIPIRADLTVHVQGLPFDLTAAEAKKIAAVIHAMAASE
jgi:hypothetical protein